MNHVPTVASLFHGRSSHCLITVIVLPLIPSRQSRCHTAIREMRLAMMMTMIADAKLNLEERDYITIQSSARASQRDVRSMKMFAIMLGSWPFEYAARWFISPFLRLSPFLLQSMPMEGRYTGTNREFTDANTILHARNFNTHRGRLLNT